MTQTISIVNQSTTFPDSSVEIIIPALQEQVSRDFAPLWGTTAEITQNVVQIPGVWTILLKDTAGNPNDLGFHIDDDNVPTAIVGVNDALHYNVPVSSVISHELLEMLADPATTRMVGNYIVEVCDPVSGDYYHIGDTAVSNFCTPRYFGYTNMGHFDQLGLLTAGVPTVRAGGMIMFWNGTVWSSTFGRLVSGQLPWRAHFAGRSTYRAIKALTD